MPPCSMNVGNQHPMFLCHASEVLTMYRSTFFQEDFVEELDLQREEQKMESRSGWTSNKNGWHKKWQQQHQCFICVFLTTSPELEWNCVGNELPEFFSLLRCHFFLHIVVLKLCFAMANIIGWHPPLIQAQIAWSNKWQVFLCVYGKSIIHTMANLFKILWQILSSYSMANSFYI